MKYHIDTIPVWDALNKDTECLLCSIRKDLEDKYVQFYLGDSVMQPDVRQKINKIGFCGAHYEMMYKESKKLPLGLACYTRIEHIREDLEKHFDIILNKEKGLKNSGVLKTAHHIKSISSGCAVCENIEENMNRYFYTFIHLWNTDEEFREAFLESKGLCINHFSEIMLFSPDVLGDKKSLQLAKDLTKVQKKNLHRLSEEVKMFNDKFDHKNAGKPWGSEKDAIPRVINKLAGHIIKK